MDISIIIVNYNTTQLLIECIKSIYQHTTTADFEIIVVDNNSPNRDVKEVSEIFSDVKLLLSEKNLGFGGANNLGSSVAKGEYLFFLNPDTLFLNNCIHYFLSFYRANDQELKIGAVGSVLLDKNLNINGSYSEDYTTFSNEIVNSIKSNFTAPVRKEKFLVQDYKEVAWVSGADLFIKKSEFNNIGGFDENIFMYYEEVDLQKRLNNMKLHNYIINGPKIIHFEGGSFDIKMSIDKKKIIDKSKFYFYKKYTKDSLTFFFNREAYKIFSWIKIYKDYGIKEAFEYFKFLNSL